MGVWLCNVKGQAAAPFPPFGIHRGKITGAYVNSAFAKDEAEEQDGGKDHPPASELHEGNARKRRHDGPEGKDHGRQCNVGGKLAARKQVAQDGSRHHRAARRADPLHCPAKQQHFGTLSKQAEHRSGCEGSQPAKQNRPSAETVGHRPGKELTDTDKGQEHRHRHLDRGIVGIEVARHQPEGRKKNVDGESRHAEQQPAIDDDLER